MSVYIYFWICVGGFYMEKAVGKYKSNDIAKYFLYKMPMTQKKLHKMLFLSYAWYLYRNNYDSNDISERLFAPVNKNHGFQAWVHGPVFRELYPIYANYGFKEIHILKYDDSIIEEEDKEFFDEIFEAYGDKSAGSLERFTHTFDSWRNAREGYGSYDACKNLLKDSEIYQDIERL